MITQAQQQSFQSFVEQRRAQGREQVEEPSRASDHSEPTQLIIKNAKIATVESANPVRVSEVLSDIRICSGQITEMGVALTAERGVRVVDAKGALVTPGFVECHSHLVPAQDRALEFALRPIKSYQEIAADGGGIVSSINATRDASEDDLFAANVRVVQQFFRQGVTTLELKSGYGQDLVNELKQLRVIQRLQDRFPGVTIIPTFLGPHAVPPEFKGDVKAYMKCVCEQILPAVIEQGIAEQADAFCEEGYFTADLLKDYFEQAKEAGLSLRVHADEFVDSKGAQLASEIGALSADHLMAVSDTGLDAMKSKGVVATVLPGTSLFVNKPVADMRKMVDKGLLVAIGTDSNPGSSRYTSLPLMWQLSMNKGKLSVEEGFAGVTRNAALSLGKSDRGVIQPGARADLIVWDFEQLAQIPYYGAESQDRIAGIVSGGRYYDKEAIQREGEKPFPNYAPVDRSENQDVVRAFTQTCRFDDQGLITHFPEAPPELDSNVPHAPKRNHRLNEQEQQLAVKNALKYLHPSLHETAAPIFKAELENYGHIYGFNFLPATHLKAIPFHQIPAKTTDARAMMHMILNNLDPAVAQFPQELITYGGNGAVFSNWMQFHATMNHLKELEPNQVLSMVSGHPQGRIPKSREESASAIITNGMMIPNYSTPEQLDRLYALGASMYGQMTAGSWMYIGPQGIVHGTHEVLKLAAAKQDASNPTLQGKVFITSGLGGMSGAQPKATTIAGGICLVAEVDEKALEKRHSQGWLDETFTDANALIERAKQAKSTGEAVSLGYAGNVVTLLESVACSDLGVELISDQTSLHNPYGGGYYPVDMSLEEAQQQMTQDPVAYKEAVQSSLRRHVAAVNTLTQKGGFFWDYGNAFLKEASLAGADLKSEYKSYVETMMGPVLFDNGFGPYRWVCTSGDAADLAVTDKIAADVIKEISENAPERIKPQLQSNLEWVSRAGENKLTVGSQARILYSNLEGRMLLAKRMNEAVASGQVKAPVVIGRDHHDVSGTDSPFRETANIKDGTNITADMAIQNVIMNALQGATWVSAHNGGGVGWGEVTNCGNGLVLDGSESATKRSSAMLFWDVAGGLIRRARAGNENAVATVKEIAERYPECKPFLPGLVD